MKNTKETSARKGKTINTFNIVTNIVMVLTIISIVIPLYFLIITAFKTYGEVYKVPPTFIVENPSLEGFELMRQYGVDIGKSVLNSLVIAGGATFTTLLFSTAAGFAFAIYRFKLKEVLFMVIISKYVIPEAILIVPWFSMMIQLGLVDNLLGVLIVNLIGAWTIFFMRSYIMQIPKDYIDAARVDGASDHYILLRIIFPLIKPALGVATVMNFLWAWNWFLWPLILLSTKTNFTLPLVVSLIRYVYGSGGEAPPHLGAVAASTMVYILPVLVLYFFAQRWILSAFTLGGVKR
uniref:Carbohydrate ABC transporter permease n=1 Tax=Ignisphaera aggregans TaxID=334771 RepID=A0A7C2VGM0_9CREN